MVMAKASYKYKSILVTEAMMKGNNLKMEDLRKVMKMYYRSKYGNGTQMNNNNNSVGGSNEVQILIIPGLENMKCYNCNKKGHRANQCPNAKRNSNGNNNDNGGQNNGNGGGGNRSKKFNGKCLICDKTGHKALDCFLNPKNKNNVPSWFKNKNRETTAVTADAGGDNNPNEFQIMMIDEPDTTVCQECEQDELKDTFFDECYYEANKSTPTKGEDELIKFYSSEEETEDGNDDESTTNSMPSLIERDDSSVESDNESEDEMENWEYVNDEPEFNMKCEETGLVVFNSTLEMVKDPNVFLIDTGASVHSTGNSFGLYDLKDPKGSSSTVGNGLTVKTKSIGKMRVTVCDKRGNELSPLTVNEMHLMPGSPFNLLSGTNMIMQGCRMIGEGSSITFTKGGWQLVCDLKIKTSRGLLYGVYLKRKPTQQQGNQEATATVITKSVKQAHQQLGHKPEDLTRQMAKHLGWTVTRGTLKPCESCARAKAKQKDIKTTKEEPSKKATEVNG
jgi:hypothetical protein